MSVIVISRYEPTTLEVYDAREKAYISALKAVRASRYDLPIRVRFLSLLDRHLGASTPGSVPRDILTYRRIARFFGRRPFLHG
jgi:hypothetical protein